MKRGILYLIFVVLLTTSSLALSSSYSTGFQGAIKNTAVKSLIEEAKKSDPKLAKTIEQLLAGVSIASSPAETLKGIWPGDIAITGIQQLLAQHKENIKKRSYKEHDMDESGFVRERPEIQINEKKALCDSLVNGYSNKKWCVSYLNQLENYNNKSKLSKGDKDKYNDILTEFYDVLAEEGKNDFIKEAGKIGYREHNKPPAIHSNNNIQTNNLQVAPTQVNSKSIDCRQLIKDYDQMWVVYKRNAGVLNCQVKGNTSGCARNTEGCRTGMLPKNVFHDRYCKKPGYTACADSFYKNYISCVRECNDAYRNTKQSIRDLTACGTQCLNTAEMGVKSCR
ncbi:MAG: hypothetical protein OQL27_09840 [Sedimenticola sp.]|nr:hypothetical protein [Sedimenticola sp.]